MDEKQKILLRKQEDARFAQGCVSVALGLLLEMYLFYVKDYYFNFNATAESLNRALFLEKTLSFSRYLGVFLLLAGFAFLAYTIFTEKGSILGGFSMMGCGFVLFACGHVALIYGEKGVSTLLFMVPAWVGLSLVYFLYQVEFFISALFTSLGGMSLWLFRQTSLYAGGELSARQLTFYTFTNISLLVILFGFYLVNKAWKTQGVLTVKKKKITLIADLKDGSSLWLVGLSGVLSFLALGVSMVFGSGLAFYCTYALLGWIFILLVYFTVKLM